MSKATIPVLEERLNHTFNAGQFDAPHGSIYAAGKLWLSAQMMPGRVARIDPDNLSSFDIATFASDGNHDRGLDIVYDGVVTNKIYVLHRHISGNYISSVDPTTMATADAITDTTLARRNINGSLAITPTHLYSGTAFGTVGVWAAGNDAVIVKYDLTDFSSTDVEISGFQQCHALRYDGTFLYATGLTEAFEGRAWVAKINPATLSYNVNFFPTGTGLPTDDFAIYGNFLYVGTELANSGKIFKIAKSNLAMTQISVRPTGANFYGLFADNTHIWAVTPLISGQGKMIRLDPTTLEQRLYTFNVGETTDGPNEIIFVPPYMFVTFFQLGAKISRLRIPTT